MGTNEDCVCKWLLSEPENEVNLAVTVIDCGVYPSEVQSFEFNTADNKPLPLFKKIKAPYYDMQQLDIT